MYSDTFLTCITNKDDMDPQQPPRERMKKMTTQIYSIFSFKYKESDTEFSFKYKFDP